MIHCGNCDAAIGYDAAARPGFGGNQTGKSDSNVRYFDLCAAAKTLVGD